MGGEELLEVCKRHLRELKKTSEKLAEIGEKIEKLRKDFDDYIAGEA